MALSSYLRPVDSFWTHREGGLRGTRLAPASVARRLPNYPLLSSRLVKRRARGIDARKLHKLGTHGEIILPRLHVRSPLLKN